MDELISSPDAPTRKQQGDDQTPVAMTVGAFYVYALKDPRTSPARPFYIGKGVGTRAWDHLLNIDDTPKGQRIETIRGSGHEVLVTILCADLTEWQAIKLEAEMIAAFGTEATGGTLTNSILPTGSASSRRPHVTVPLGAPEKAQMGLNLLKDAVLELAQANMRGVTNSDVCHALGLHSDYLGGSKDYLSWSILGLLMSSSSLNPSQRQLGVSYCSMKRMVAFTLPRCVTRHKLGIQRYKGRADRQIATLFEQVA
jgi:hypothetical protein